MTIGKAKQLVEECGLNIEEPLHDEVMHIIKVALDRQISKNPTIHKAGFYCSNCGILIGLVRNEINFCKKCGQAIDWSDTE